MMKLMLLMLMNLLLGATLSVLGPKMPAEALVLAIVAILFAFCITLMVMLPGESNEPETAENALKEGEIYYRLSVISSAREAKKAGIGILVLICSNKHKGPQLLLFKERPPSVFTLKKGKIVPHA